MVLVCGFSLKLLCPPAGGHLPLQRGGRKRKYFTFVYVLLSHSTFGSGNILEASCHDVEEWHLASRGVARA